jgi:hypothetical protein
MRHRGPSGTERGPSDATQGRRNPYRETIRPRATDRPRCRKGPPGGTPLVIGAARSMPTYFLATLLGNKVADL